MDKIIELTKLLQKTETETEEKVSAPKVEKVTNPIFKKLAKFQNSKLSKKLDINDLI